MSLTIANDRILLKKGRDTIFDTREPMPYIRLMAGTVITFQTPKPKFVREAETGWAWTVPRPTVLRSNFNTGRVYPPGTVTPFGGGTADNGHYVCSTDSLTYPSSYNSLLSHTEIYTPGGGPAPSGPGPYKMLACNYSMKLGLVEFSSPDVLKSVQFIYGRITHQVWPRNSSPIDLTNKTQIFSGSMVLNQVHKYGQGAVITEIASLYMYQQFFVFEFQVSHAFSPGWDNPAPFTDDMFIRRIFLEVFVGGFK